MSEGIEEVAAERMPSVRDRQGLAESQNEPATIERLLAAAIDKGTNVESLEKLVTLYERVQDRHAAGEFAAAMSEVQQEMALIAKVKTSKRSSDVSRSGAKFEFRYAGLDDIAEALRPVIHERGLSYRWTSDVDDKRAKAILIVSHRNGHKETTEFACPIDASSHMNPMQRAESSLSYAKRATLTMAFGLVTADPETDIAPGNAEKITVDQKDTLRTMMQETRSNVDAFMRFMGVNAIDDILQAQYPRAVAALEQKRKSL